MITDLEWGQRVKKEQTADPESHAGSLGMYCCPEAALRGIIPDECPSHREETLSMSFDAAIDDVLRAHGLQRLRDAYIRQTVISVG